MLRHRAKAGVRWGYLLLAGWMTLVGNGCASPFSNSPTAGVAVNPVMLPGESGMAAERLRSEGRARAWQAQIRKQFQIRAVKQRVLGARADRVTEGRGGGAILPGAQILPMPGAPAFSEPIVAPVYLSQRGSE